MDDGRGILRLCQSLVRWNFGHFHAEELKKFLRMGVIFALIIGIYWTLRPLKDSIFIQLAGSSQLPLAKTASLFALLPLVMFYTNLLETTSKERMLILVPTFYGLAILGFALLVMGAQDLSEEVRDHFFLAINILGYSWYIFVESFGSLVVALFWAFAADTTQASSAKRGFPLVVAIGQLGGIILPYSIGGLPHRLGHTTDGLSIFCLALLTLLIIPLVHHFFRTTAPDLLTSFEGLQEKSVKKEAGFLEGLKLLVKNRYLLAIFSVNFIYEVIVTIFDFNFKIEASAHYTKVALSHYLSIYASSVNLVSLLSLILGISNITRFLGVGTALALMPIIVGCALVGFLTLNSLSFLFALMVGSKAINYALNGPTLKQLYIPTTSAVKFKSQAWIETFGSRSSKQVGSMLNLSLTPLQSIFGVTLGKSYYLMISGFLCFPLLAFWFFVALFLGRSFQRAIRDNRLIC